MVEDIAIFENFPLENANEIYISNLSAPNSNLMMGGRGVGNGGDALVCRDNNGKIQNAILLDYYEATQTQMELELGDANFSVEQKVRYILNRIKNYDPIRPLLLEEEIAKLLTAIKKYNENGIGDNVVKFVSNAYLQDINDSNHIVTPRGCQVEQLAIKINLDNVSPNIQHDYYIDKEIWDALDTSSQAGLVLHESIYHYLKKIEKHINSVSARFYNRFISSLYMNNINYINYVMTLRNTGISTTALPALPKTTIYIEDIKQTESGNYVTSHRQLVTLIFDKNGKILLKEMQLRPENRIPIYYNIKGTLSLNDSNLVIKKSNDIEQEVYHQESRPLNQGLHDLFLSRKKASYQNGVPVGKYEYNLTINPPCKLKGYIGDFSLQILTPNKKYKEHAIETNDLGRYRYGSVKDQKEYANRWPDYYYTEQNRLRSNINEKYSLFDRQSTLTVTGHFEITWADFGIPELDNL